MLTRTALCRSARQPPRQADFVVGKAPTVGEPGA
jgi:hypothetical protein